MADHVVSWLARKSLLARTVTIKVRYNDFTTVTRSHSAPPTQGFRRAHRAEQYNCSTERTPDAGPFACSASACTISVGTATSSKTLPIGCRSRTKTLTTQATMDTKA